MKGQLSQKADQLEVPTVLQAVKERLIEKRFNIDTYDRTGGTIQARRNSLDMVVIGAYRRTSISVKKDQETGKIGVEFQWGGVAFGALVTFAELFLISIAILRELGSTGLLISCLIALIGTAINIILFNYLRARFRSVLSRDIRDLNDEAGSEPDDQG